MNDATPPDPHDRTAAPRLVASASGSLTTAPRLVFWEATAGCNLACQHCRRLEVSRALSRHDLTTEQAKHCLIDGLLSVGRSFDSAPGLRPEGPRSGFRPTRTSGAPPVLVCSGGEPLMRPDLFDVGAYAAERGLPIALATNGTLIDEALADRIVATGFERVAISLDGADAATHDAFRQQAGAFEAAVRGLRYLRKRKMSVQVNTTVTLHNLRQLHALYEYVADLGAEAWHVFMFVPVGCGLEIPVEQQLLAEQYETVLVWLAERAAEQRLFVRATCAPQYYRIMAQRRTLHQFHQASKFATMTKGCLAGTGICFVSHRGDVFPCGYLPVSSGNICRQPFSQIWADSPIFAALRDPEALTGKCGACEFKRLCSGCRARAYAASGNFLSEEPCCAYVPGLTPKTGERLRVRAEAVV